MASDPDRPRKPILSRKKPIAVPIVVELPPPEFPDFTYDDPEADEFLVPDAYTTSRKKARKSKGSQRQRPSRKESKWQ